MRIVSLLPSATEIICSLGLRDQLVGVTHECDYPLSVLELPKVTRTLIPHDASSARIDELVRERLRTQKALYTLDLPTLETLQPDLIVTQTLCEVCAVAEEEVRSVACNLPGQPRVINLEPLNLADILECIRTVGQATGCQTQAEANVKSLQTRMDLVARRTLSLKDRPRVVLLEWLDPPFSCGHWSPTLVALAGGDEQLGVEGQASRTLKWSEVSAARPDVLFIACCGFSLERTMTDVELLANCPGWMDLSCTRRGKVFAVDGSAYISRPGPRLVDSLEILANALFPGLHPLPQGLPSAVRVNVRIGDN